MTALVCSSCGTVSCWQGEMFCEDYRTASAITRDEYELRGIAAGELREGDALPRCQTTHPVLGKCRGILGTDHPHYGVRNRKFKDHPMSGHPQDRDCLCGVPREPMPGEYWCPAGPGKCDRQEGHPGDHSTKY